MFAGVGDMEMSEGQSESVMPGDRSQMKFWSHSRRKREDEKEAKVLDKEHSTRERCVGQCNGLCVRLCVISIPGCG